MTIAPRNRADMWRRRPGPASASIRSGKEEFAAKAVEYALIALLVGAAIVACAGALAGRLIGA